MQKKTILLIDGGHLRALARAQGISYTPEFIERFSATLRAEEEDLVRVLYYDCAPFNGRKRRPVSNEIIEFNNSGQWLDDLASRDLFAVRLGILKWRGWQPKRIPVLNRDLTDDDFKPSFEQKGVDLRIGLDVASYSAGGFVDRILMVTGDTDLIPAMKVARRHGVQIVGIEFPNGHISRELAAHIDIRRRAEWPGIDNSS